MFLFLRIKLEMNKNFVLFSAFHPELFKWVLILSIIYSIQPYPHNHYCFIIFEFWSFQRKYSQKISNILSMSDSWMLAFLMMLSLNWTNFIQEAQFKWILVNKILKIWMIPNPDSKESERKLWFCKSDPNSSN